MCSDLILSSYLNFFFSFFQPETKGEVNPAMDDKNDADNSPFTVYKNGGLSNPAMEEEIPNHMSGSQV